jgi:hypothetical protein
VFDAKEKGKRVTFSQLVNFMSREARKVNDSTYGKIAMSGDKGEKTAQWRGHSKGSFATIISNATSEGSNRQTENHAAVVKSGEYTQKSCIYCSKLHSIDTCREFDRLPMDEKMKCLRSIGACFGCLKLFHRNKDCRNRATCSKCQKRHPTVLHITDKETSTVFGESATTKPKHLLSLL